MSDIPEALVEKAAAAVAEADYAAGRGILNRPDARFLAREALAAVWPDLPAVRPVVDRDALAEVLSLELSRRMDEADCDALADEVADAILASGVLQDAADVRRAVAEEAWNEGYRASDYDGRVHDYETRTPNPYRTAATQSTPMPEHVGGYPGGSSAETARPPRRLPRAAHPAPNHAGRIDLDALTARVRAEVAEEIAAAIEERKPHIPVSSDPQRRERIVQRVTFNAAARIAREAGSA